MGGGNKLRAGLLAVFVIAAVLPATARATSPTDFAVDSTVDGHLTGTWTLPAGTSADYIDVGTTPRVDSFGDFELEVEVWYELLANGDTSWTSSVTLPPGTYYVHLATYDTAACADLNNPSCVEEFTDAKEIAVAGTQPQPAHPPVLDSVTQSGGVITANWTLDPDESSSFVEVASSSDPSYPGGGFLVGNTVIWAPVGGSDTTYTSAEALAPGAFMLWLSRRSKK